jgi:hypothetical protein
LILAYRLNHEEFKNWVEMELDGYAKDNEGFEDWSKKLPDYRKIYPQVYGDISSRFYRNPMAPIIWPDMVKILPAEYRIVHLEQGIPSLEKLLEIEGDLLANPWPDFLVHLLNEKVFQNQGQICASISNTFPKSQVIAIIETVRNRLLKFTLELMKADPKLDKDQSDGAISDRQLSRIYNITIAQGGNMSLFDQSNQSIQGDQYNAAGDINFNGIHNVSQLANELQKFLSALPPALENIDIDADTKLDTDYHIKKAIQQVKSDAPDKSKIIEHLSKAKSVIQGITQLAGFAVLLEKAIETVTKLIH